MLNSSYILRFLLLCITMLPCALAQEATARVPDPEAHKLISSRVDPEYPPMAKQLRLTGSVQVDVYLDATGSIEKVQVVNGHPLLSSATVSAVKKWKFLPFTAEGKGIHAVARYNIAFHL